MYMCAQVWNYTHNYMYIVTLVRGLLPTSVSRHVNTLRGGKIHCYNDIHEIAKTPISPSSFSSSVDRHNSKSA